MARRRNPGIALSSLQEDLQSLPFKRAVGASDKRSLGRGRRLLGELGQFKASAIAEQMGISTQKYVAVRRGVEEKKVSSSVLNDLLENVLGELNKAGQALKEIAGYSHTEHGTYISEKPVRGRRKFPISYVIASKDFMEDNVKWSTSAKPGGLASLQSVLNWYGGVTGGAEYFWIVQDDTDRYFVYDVRTTSEKNRKGKVHGQTKAMKVYDKYEPIWSEHFSHKEKNAKPAKK